MQPEEDVMVNLEFSYMDSDKSFQNIDRDFFCGISVAVCVCTTHE